MGLATTFQLVIDAEYLRRRFKPQQAFNKVCLIEGKYIDFDTFLYIQYLSEKISVSEIDESQMFHPTQMICQFTDFMAGRDSLSNTQHNLLALVYMQYLGGNNSVLPLVSDELKSMQSEYITFNSKKLSIGHLKKEQWAWMEKQIRRLEQALFVNTRPEVATFLAQLAFRAGEKRTVGVENPADGGVADD